MEVIADNINNYLVTIASDRTFISVKDLNGRRAGFNQQNALNSVKNPGESKIAKAGLTKVSLGLLRYGGKPTW